MRLNVAEYSDQEMTKHLGGARAGKPSAMCSHEQSDFETRYSLGFTAASLRPELARIIAECYLVEGNWERAKNRVLSTNALQCRSASSLVRMERELRQRVTRLTFTQIKLLAHATSEDRAAMAWLAAQKQYKLIFEFAAEVLREKLSAHDPVLRQSDYEVFLENKAVVHPELIYLSNVSKKKARQVLLLMLTEGGLLRDGAAMGNIQRPVLSDATIQAIRNDSSHWFAGFLFSDEEIRCL
jgi:hypothetical protein